MRRPRLYQGVLALHYAAGYVWTLQAARKTYELRGPVPDLPDRTPVDVIARLDAQAQRLNPAWPVLQVMTVARR